MTRYPLRSVLGLLTVITVVLIMGMIFRPTEFAAAFPAQPQGCGSPCLVLPEGCGSDQVPVGEDGFCVTCGSAEEMLGRIENCTNPETCDQCELLFQAKLACCQQDSNFDCDGDGNPGGSGSCPGLNSFINDWPDEGTDPGECPALTRDQKLQLICCYLQKCSGSGGSSCNLIDCASDILGGLSGKEKKDLEECGGGGGGGGDCGGGGGGTEEGGGRGTEGPLPGPGECSFHNETQSTPSSGEPVDLFHGDKVESAVDLRVAVSGIDFKLTREYSSNPEFHSSAIIGKHWTASPFRFFTISPPEGPGGCCSQCTGMNHGQWCRDSCECDPEQLPAIIELDGPTAQYFWKTCTSIEGTNYSVWRLIDPGNWEIDYYRDLDTGESGCTAPDLKHIGLMAATRDMYGNTKTFHYSTYGTGPNEITRLSWIEIRNQANVEEANVLFYWRLDSSDVNVGKLRRVDVQRPDRTGVPVLTQRVYYTYMDGTDPAFASDLGLDGDLIQVVRYERVDPDPGDQSGDPVWRKYVTQYRYHNAWEDSELIGIDVDKDGFFEKGNEHQLRMIFPPEQIEFAAQQQADFDNQLGDVEAFGSTMLTKGDGAVAWDGQTAVKVVDLAAKVLEEYEEWDAADPSNKPGRVKTQYVQSNCGCGGGGTQGKKLTYDYFNWTIGVGRTLKVTEYFKDAPWTLHRTIYHDLDLQGPPPGQGEPDRRTPYLVNKAVIDPSGLAWVTHHVYDSATRTLFQKMTPSAKNIYTPADGTNTPYYEARLNDGLIYVYAYTAGPQAERNHLAVVQVKEGVGGTSIVISQTTYFDNFDTDGKVYLPKRIERIRVEGADPATEPDKVEVVEYKFAFHGNDGHDIEWIETTVEAELEPENGPGGNYLSYELFDANGYNYWSIAADGSYTKRIFDTDDANSVSKTGRVVEVLRNSDNTGFPVVTGFTPSAHRNGDGGSLKTLYVRDLLGRVQERVTPGEVSTYTLREMRVFPGRTDLKYYAVVTLPHEFGNPAEYDGPGTITWYNADDDVIGSSDYKIKVAHTFAPAPTSQDGYTQVIINYDLDGDAGGETGQLARTEIAHDVSGLVTSRSVWHSLAGLGAGGGIYTTKYFYDSLGRLDYSINPQETVIQNTYDVLDRVIKVEAGIASGDNPSNMNDVVEYIYDGSGDTQGDGNGNLTRVRQLVNSTSTNDRVTDNTYDFRDRLIKVSNPIAPHEFVVYDNLNRVIKRAVFEELPVGNDPDDIDDATKLAERRRYLATAYSQRGIVYRTRLAIDPTIAEGSLTFLETHTWFDEVGRPVGTWAPNGPGTKTTYDGLGRPEITFTTDRGGDADPGATGNYADVYDTSTHVAKVNGDVVLQQSQYDYVAGPVQAHAGQMDLVTTLRRTHDAPDTTSGDLTLISDPKQAITTYAGTYFDGADRVIRSVDYGTNIDDQFKFGGTAPTINQASPPDWDTTGGELVSETAYNSRGLVDSSTSPDGDVAMNFYDDLNRRIVVAENRVDIDEADIIWNIPDQTPDRWVIDDVGGTAGNNLDQDRATSFVYDGINNVIVQTAHQPDATTAGDQDQVTEYRYGVTTTDNPGASDFHSNDLLRQVIYPDDEIQEADHSVYYAYNRAGELIFTEDQNTTEHTYTRDDLGRVTEDEVTDFGANIDDDIQVITTSYTNYGLVETVKSLNSVSSVVNAVKFEYDGLWQVTDVHQENNGNVDGSTLKVQYRYDTNKMADGNFSRMDKLTYPDGKAIVHGYGGSTSSNSRISRSKTIDIFAFVEPLNKYASYDYIGLNMFAQVDYEKIDVQLDRTASHGGKRQTQGNTDNPGLYPGFDRFGRVIRHMWVDGDFTEHDTDITVPKYPPIVELKYTYDKDSNRTAAYDDRPGGVQELSHEYTYDGIDRLTEAVRGLWNGSTLARKNDSQKWALDMLGNWDSIDTDLDGDGVYTGTDEQEDRNHDDATDANELDQRKLIGQGFPSGDLDLDLTYDKAGNLRTEGRDVGPGAVTWTYTHDAWNRLVKIVSSTGPTKAEYEYNGLNWRIIKRADTPGSGSGLDQQRMMYYSGGWQLLEERIDDDSPFTDDPTHADIDRHVQYVWGQRYIDDLILHREDGDVNGTYDDTWYHLTDVQFSTVAILDDAAALVERVSYDAYGNARHHYMADWDGDGGVTQSEIDQINTVAGGANHAIGEDNYNPDMDGDRNGDIQTADYTIANNEGTHAALAKGLLSDPSVDNQIGWDGYVFNAETQMYTVRFRCYRPVLGRWLERDPLGTRPDVAIPLEIYSDGPELFDDPVVPQISPLIDPYRRYDDGMSLYETVHSNPVGRSDPSGLGCKICWQCTYMGEYTRGRSKFCRYSCVEHPDSPRNRNECFGGGTCCSLDLPKRGKIGKTHTTKIKKDARCPKMVGKSLVGFDRHCVCYGEFAGGEWGLCSIKKCTLWCDILRRIIKKGCKGDPVTKKACEEAAEIAAGICHDGCVSWCKQA